MAGILSFFKSKDCNYSEKLCFLIDQTYRHFSKKHKIRIGNSVDFDYSFYAKQSTFEALLPVIKERRINKCFLNCVEQMKTEGKFSELQVYGIL